MLFYVVFMLYGVVLSSFHYFVLCVVLFDGVSIKLYWVVFNHVVLICAVLYFSSPFVPCWFILHYGVKNIILSHLK